MRSWMFVDACQWCRHRSETRGILQACIGSRRGRSGTALEEPGPRSLHSAKWDLGTSKPSRDMKRGGHQHIESRARRGRRERDQGRRARAADAPTRSPSLETSILPLPALRGPHSAHPPLLAAPRCEAWHRAVASAVTQTAAPQPTAAPPWAPRSTPAARSRP